MSDSAEKLPPAEVVHLCRLPKREFIVTFAPEAVTINQNKMSADEQLFFEEVGDGTHEIVIPVGVKRRELIPFIGHKVRMTLEVLPW